MKTLEQRRWYWPWTRTKKYRNVTADYRDAAVLHDQEADEVRSQLAVCERDAVMIAAQRDTASKEAAELNTKLVAEMRDSADARADVEQFHRDYDALLNAYGDMETRWLDSHYSGRWLPDAEEPRTWYVPEVSVRVTATTKGVYTVQDTDTGKAVVTGCETTEMPLLIIGDRCDVARRNHVEPKALTPGEPDTEVTDLSTLGEEAVDLSS